MNDLDLILKYRLTELIAPLVTMDITDYLKKNKLTKICFKKPISLESQEVQLLEITKKDIKIRHSNGRLEKIKLKNLSIEVLLAIKLLIDRNII
jgi:hypothetical protein